MLNRISKKLYGTNKNPVTKAANSTGREATLVPSQAAEKKSSDNYNTLFIKYLSKRFAGYQILYKTHEFVLKGTFHAQNLYRSALGKKTLIAISCQNPREASSRSRIFLISLVFVCICVTPPGQTKNDTDLKFGTHTPIDLI